MMAVIKIFETEKFQYEMNAKKEKIIERDYLDRF